MSDSPFVLVPDRPFVPESDSLLVLVSVRPLFLPSNLVVGGELGEMVGEGSVVGVGGKKEEKGEKGRRAAEKMALACSSLSNG